MGVRSMLNMGTAHRRIGLLALYLLFAAASVSTPPTAFALEPAHVYQLNGNLEDDLAGPDLVASGGTLSGTSYSFAAGQGLALSGALNDPGIYSIELAFSYSDLDYWRKIIDFKDLTSNNGVYTDPFNSLYFYPLAVGPARAMRRETSVNLVITRDAAKEVVVYADGVQQLSFTDSLDEAVFSEPDAIIHFFKDDATTSQTAAGVVHRIRIWDGVLTSAEVAAHVGISPRDDAVSNGEIIDFDPVGGSSPFTFSITNNNSGATIDSSTGVYASGNNRGLDSVRVTDDLGDIAEASVLVLGALTPFPELTHAFEFDDGLTDEYLGWPLVASGGTVNASAYSFGPSQGLALSDAFANTGNYSIELVFSFSDLDYWRKIIDFKDLTSNNGLYNDPSNSLYFYNRAAGPAGAMRKDIRANLVVTRDATNDQFIVYVDGVQQTSFTDAAFEAIFTETNAIVHFFNDDATLSQNSAGVVERIRVWDGVLSPNDVAGHVRIAPWDVAASNGETIDFDVLGGIGSFTFSIRENGSGATINPSTGLYTTGNNRGFDSVRVSDAENGDIAEARVIALGLLAPAPILTHAYELNGDLTDELGGPPLVASGGTLSASDYSFLPGQGLALSNGLVNTGNYSIELVFSLSMLDSWFKIIDFKDLTSNFGLYSDPGNRLYFYPRSWGPLAVLQQDIEVNVVVTRDATTDQFTVYLDGIQLFSFVDSALDGIFTGPDTIIHFFQDDATLSQNPAGVVDQIRIWDGALDEAAVADLLDDHTPPVISSISPTPICSGHPITKWSRSAWRLKSRTWWIRIPNAR